MKLRRFLIPPWLVVSTFMIFFIVTTEIVELTILILSYRRFISVFCMILIEDIDFIIFVVFFSVKKIFEQVSSVSCFGVGMIMIGNRL